MKKLLFTMAALLLLALPSSAMSYEQARQQALFLTDKMAYELNLSEAQYEAAYEINLDYLMSINTVDDLAGNYWRWRNLDMSYVLLEWQYRAFCDAAYFYRPLYWDTGCWHFAIYARYPHRDYFYFHRPTVYVSYRGGHSWRQNNGRSWYSGRTFGSRRGDNYFGMRDGFQRGDYGRGNRQSFGSRGNRLVEQKNNNSGFGSRRDNNAIRRNINGVASGSSRDVNGFGSGSRRDNNSFGSSRGSSSFGSRESSTRTTVRQSDSGSSSSSRSFGSGRSNRSFGSSVQSIPRSTFKPVDSSSRGSSMSFGSSRSSSSFGSSRSSGSSFGSSRSSSPSRSSSSFGGGSSSRGSSSSRGGGFGSRR